jgi:hypothetical protein
MNQYEPAILSQWPRPDVCPLTLLISREASAHLLRGSDRLMQSFTRRVYNETFSGNGE